MDAEPPLELPQVLRALLVKTRLTQRRFADACGISTNEVNDIVRGRRRQVQVGTFDAIYAGLERLAPAAGITPEELAGVQAAYDHDRARPTSAEAAADPERSVPEASPPTPAAASPGRPTGGTAWWRRAQHWLPRGGHPRPRARRILGALAALLVVVLAVLALVIPRVGLAQSRTAPPLPGTAAGPPLVAGAVPRCPASGAAPAASPFVLRLTYPATTRCTNTAAGMAVQFVATPALADWYAGEVDVLRVDGLMPPEQNVELRAVLQFLQPQDRDTAVGLIVLTPEQGYGGTLVLLNAGTRVWQVMAVDSHAQHLQIATGTLPAAVRSDQPITLTVQLHARALFVQINQTWVGVAIPLSAEEQMPRDRAFGVFVDCPACAASSPVVVEQIALLAVH